MAKNPATLVDLLWRLIKAPAAVSEAAARPDISADLAEAILQLGDPLAVVRLGKNAMAPAAIRSRLADHTDAMVRTCAAHGALNGMTGPETEENAGTAVRWC